MRDQKPPSGQVTGGRDLEQTAWCGTSQGALPTKGWARPETSFNLTAPTD